MGIPQLLVGSQFASLEYGTLKKLVCGEVMGNLSKFKFLPNLIIAICVILFSLATVYWQVETVTIRFIKIKQMENHVDIMQGDAGDPWQYRLLSDYVAEALLRFVTWIGYPRPGISAFVLFRLLQNILIFSLAALYYRKLGLNHYLTLLGMSILTWGMTHALYDSDLSFNLYSDIAFYLIAGILILKRKYIWTIPLIILAAFNRETSGLIPFMILAAYLIERPPEYKLGPVIAIVVAGVILYAIIFFGLRWYYGPRELITAYGYRPGYGLFRFNIDRFVTWMQLTLTLGIIPIMAVVTMRRWPVILRSYFWAVIPIWFVIHFIVAILAETRLVLVPQALVFIPGALFGIPGLLDKTDVKESVEQNHEHA